MVNDKDFSDHNMDVTDEDDNYIDELELEDEEEMSGAKLKQLRQKLHKTDEEKRALLETMQRERADFLNARKRLETERGLDKLRFTKRHVEALLPLCDSFEMALKDKEAWEKAEPNWRKGIEGIHTQLKRLMESYQVTAIGEEGEAFNPYKHEAIGISEVIDKTKHDTVVAVLQRGYEITEGGTTEIIRPARVTTGEYSE